MILDTYKTFLINGLLLLGCIVGAIFFQSRSFVIGYLFAFFCLLYLNNKIKINSKTLLLLGPLMLSVVLSIAFFFKADSSSGRLFIYKISWLIFKDNWSKGVGYENFGKLYGLYQANYFFKGQYSKKEFLLADNTYFVFNDYWQFIIETGMIGFVTIVLFIMLTCFLARRACAINKNSFILQLAITQLTSILIAACFTHLFERLIFILLIIVWILIIGFFNIEAQNRKRISFIVLVCACIVIAFRVYTYYIKKEYYESFENAKRLSSIGYLKESLITCSKVYPHLKDDIDFLKFYSDELYSLNDYSLTESVLKRLSKKRTNNLIYKKLGDVLLKQGKLIEAEQAYITAVNIVPNRFKTRESLFNFYITTSEYQKAMVIGHFVLKMPVKIPSSEIDRIKRYVTKMLN